MSATLIIILALVALTPILLSSAFICVPKWYTKSIQPIFESPKLGPLSMDVGEQLARVPAPPGAETALKVLLVAVATIPLTAFAIIILWVSASISLINQRCPFTSPSTRHDDRYIGAGGTRNACLRILRNPVAWLWRA